MSKIAAGLQFAACFLLCFQAVVPDHANPDRANEFPKPEAPPKPNSPDLLSQIGGLIMDVDEAVWKQTEPLRNIEAKLVDRTFKGSVKPPSEYISRIRDNYREMQKRIGSTLVNPLGLLNSEDNAYTKDSPLIRTLFDNLKQSEPRASESQSLEMRSDDGHDDSGDAGTLNPVESILSQLTMPDFDGKFRVGETMVRFHNKDSSAALHVNREPSSQTGGFQKRFGEMDQDQDFEESKPDVDFQDATEDFNFLPGEEERERPSSFTTEDLENYLSKEFRAPDPRPADYEMRFNVGPNLARIGDIRELTRELYLSIMNDERYRRVLRNHVVNWIFDPSVDPNSPVVKKLQKARLATRDMVSNKHSGNRKHDREYGYDHLQKRHGSLEDVYDDYDDFPPPTSYYYDVVNSQGMRKEIDRAGMIFEGATTDYGREHLPNRHQTVVLAFTPDGLPLRLGFNPSVRNPIRYLRRIMSEAGVYLNVPTDSSGTKPAGAKILQLGEVDSEAENPLFVNMSDLNQQRTLFSSLRSALIAHHEAEVEAAYEDSHLKMI